MAFGEWASMLTVYWLLRPDWSAGNDPVGGRERFFITVPAPLQAGFALSLAATLGGIIGTCSSATHVLPRLASLISAVLIAQLVLSEQCDLSICRALSG